MKKLGGSYTPDQVKFGGVRGMLDLADRVKPISDMDTGRMRWACELLDETQSSAHSWGTLRCAG
eukprot:45217-Lingulodinium_polyedra.AAC.1